MPTTKKNRISQFVMRKRCSHINDTLTRMRKPCAAADVLIGTDEKLQTEIKKLQTEIKKLQADHVKLISSLKSGELNNVLQTEHRKLQTKNKKLQTKNKKLQADPENVINSKKQATQQIGHRAQKRIQKI
jgi:uncharacterized protein (DUF3084 family)